MGRIGKIFFEERSELIMIDKNNSVETPKTENIQESAEISRRTHTAYSIMNFAINEYCSKWLDKDCMSYSDIVKFSNNRNNIVILANNSALPEVMVDWTKQRIKIDDRFIKSNYAELYNSKKELSVEEYCDLKESINNGATGVTMKELMQLTDKDEYLIGEILLSKCYLTVADHSPCELLMGDTLDMYLIPIVNEENQLTGEFRIKYLFTSEAVSILAENMAEEYGTLLID